MKRDMNQNPHKAPLLCRRLRRALKPEKLAAKYRRKDGPNLGDILAGSGMEYIYQSNAEDPPYIWYSGGRSKMKKIPPPMWTWADECRLAPELLRAVERAGYKKPSPIQTTAIPLGLQQCDVIGIAETGSGKKAAFVLPMLTHLSTKLPPMPRSSSEENQGVGPYALVLAPTREIALQIENETVKFADFLGIKVVSIVGGQSIEEQGFKIGQGCEVVIATPGCLIDCLERRYADLNQCDYVVLYEVDRMVDIGFGPLVVGVLDAIPSSNLKPENKDEELDKKKIYRTTCMFSTTMPPSVEELAKKYLRNPVVVAIGTAAKATDLITQQRPLT
ncbi:hypothetical protein Vadar_021879 [Vaccinium darrowii]|uniref:Uncharacterized protein n=1 Tax=Vaccinium darrowii TaxID=229202 RepID=A0ACB7Y844_9ERIC|nr:hypothetical protein Vadar_021879 [Vaccinium darrowii]